MATQRVTRSQARLFAQLIAEYEPRIQRAFMASVTDLQANVNWPALLDALQRADTNAAIAALNISPAAWAEYSAAVSETFAAAGASTAAQIQALGIAGIGIRFNMTNPRAERWIRENVANMVTGFVQEQVDAARELIQAGYAQGMHPRSIGLDLVGRATGPGGAREGGIMGLDKPRAQRFMRVVQGMRTPEGVQDLVIRHRDGALSLRYKVNKATANRILKAYNAGTAVPQDERIISERQYGNALLKARADTVADTEVANAVMGGRDEEWRQLLEDEGLSSNDVIKTWQHRRGTTGDYRPDHLAMSGKSVRGIDTPFEFPDGTQLKYAHDPDGGASHIINCGCSTEYRLDHARGLQ